MQALLAELLAKGAFFGFCAVLISLACSILTLPLYLLTATSFPATRVSERWTALLGRCARALAHSLGFAVAGACVGILAGNSRVPVVTEMLPALLTAIGGLGALYLGRNESVDRPMLLAAVTAMSLSLLVSTAAAAELRSFSASSRNALEARGALLLLCKIEEAKVNQQYRIATNSTASPIDMDCNQIKE